MKKNWMLGLLWAGALGAQAAALNVVEVNAPSINCVFNTNCAVVVEDTVSEFAIPNSLGAARLITRTFQGEAGSPGANLYVYQYQIDLASVTAIDPALSPCVGRLKIAFGPAAPLDLNGDGLADQAYVITSGADGTTGPSTVEQNGNEIEFVFGNASICAGGTSFAMGLVSQSPPTGLNAAVLFTDGNTVTAGARGPVVAGTEPPGEDICDLASLRSALTDLSAESIAAPTPSAREGRRHALLNRLKAAERLAARGLFRPALNGLRGIEMKAGSRKNAWIQDDPATPENEAELLRQQISAVMDSLQAQFDQTEKEKKAKKEKAKKEKQKKGKGKH